MGFFDISIVRFAAAVLVFGPIATMLDQWSIAPLILLLIGLILWAIALCFGAIRPFLPIGIAAACVGLSATLIAHTAVEAAANNRSIQSGDALLVGTISEGANRSRDAWRHVVDVESIDGEVVSTRLVLVTPVAHVTGERIEVFAEIRPQVADDFPTSYPYQQKLWNRGVSGSAVAREEPVVMRSSSAFVASIERNRIQLEDHLVATLPTREAGFALALMTGNKRLLQDPDRYNFADTGTAHVLAISGLHFGVIAAFLWGLLGVVVNRMPWVLVHMGRRRACGILVSLGLLAYLVFVGAPISAVRAWTVANLFILGLTFQRQTCSAVALCAAAAAVVILDPWLVRDIGFQLSFAASGGIITLLKCMPLSLQPPPFSNETDWQRRVRGAKSFVAVSTAATLATTPALAMHFGTISIGAFWTNLIVVPFVSAVAFPLVLIGSVMSTASIPLGSQILALGLWCFSALSDGLKWVCDLPGNLLVVGAISSTSAVLLTIACFCAIAFARQRVRPIAILSAVLGLCVWAVDFTQRPDVVVDFLPVGQGDSTLVLIDGHSTLVDAGGSRFGSGPGYRTIIPHLRRRGVDRVDLAVVTHWDVDHYQGFEALIERAPPANWLVPDAPAKLKLPHSVGVPARHGQTLWRAMALRSENDSSVVGLVPENLFLSGDIETRAEQRWVSEGLSTAPILKVPHHGSSTSSSPAFIDAISPRVAVWSAARKNRFGHPDADVLNRYRKRGIWVFGTAEHGLVTVESRGEVFTVKTAKP